MIMMPFTDYLCSFKSHTWYSEKVLCLVFLEVLKRFSLSYLLFSHFELHLYHRAFSYVFVVGLKRKMDEIFG